MGTWSITPNNGLASIDANSGVATFREHTSDVTYTIHFSDSTCTGGEVTKTFMVFACSQPTCDCSTFSAATSGTRVPSTTSSTEYIVGRYTAATNCSDSISISARTGTDFLTGLRASGGNIYAKVAVANTGSERSSTYFVRQGGCEDYFTAYQSSGGTPPTPCTCNDLRVSGDKTIGSSARSNFEIGTYTAGCVTNIAASEPADWITSISASNGSIKASVNENTSTTNTRATEITVTGKAGSDTCTKSFTLTQNPKSETCTTCNDANIQGLSGGATAEGGTNILIGSFSYSCDPGLTAKRVSGGDFITNMTVSNGNVYGTVSPNTTTSERTEVIGIYVGTSKCAQYTLAQPAQICTPQLTVSATSTCCVNFKVVQPCSDIQLYDVIEWGYSKTNTPIFTNGQAFSSKSATGATGINQCPGDVSSPYNYYIFWRNKTAHSVSGSQYVTLTGCAPAVCDCDAANVQVGTTAITLGNAAYSTANTTYSHDCTVYINNNEAQGWLDVNSTGGRLEFNSISEATSVRSANVYIDDINGEHCKTIKVTQEGPHGCLKTYQRSIEVKLKIDSSVAIGSAAVNLNGLDSAELEFIYGNSSPEGIDLAGAQENSVYPGQETTWNPTDDLNGVICTDVATLESYSFGGFPEGFTISIGGEDYECRQRSGKPNGHYATTGTSLYFRLGYDVRMVNGNVRFTITMYDDN